MIIFMFNFRSLCSKFPKTLWSLIFHISLPRLGFFSFKKGNPKFSDSEINYVMERRIRKILPFVIRWIAPKMFKTFVLKCYTFQILFTKCLAIHRSHFWPDIVRWPAVISSPVSGSKELSFAVTKCVIFFLTWGSIAWISSDYFESLLLPR